MSPSFDREVGNQQDLDSITAALDLSFRQLHAFSASDLQASEAARSSALALIATIKVEGAIAVDRLVEASALYTDSLEDTRTLHIAIVGALYGVVAALVVSARTARLKFLSMRPCRIPFDNQQNSRKLRN